MSLAALETSTVASGIRVADAVVKMAPVALLYAAAGVAGQVRRRLRRHASATSPPPRRRGIEAAGAALTDSLVLAQCHGDVHRVLAGLAAGPAGDALGVIETDGVPSTLLAADRAAKTAPVRLRTIRLADGLGGRGFVLFDGTLSDVNAAVDRRPRPPSARTSSIPVVVPRLAEPVRDRLY